MKQDSPRDKFIESLRWVRNDLRNNIFETVCWAGILTLPAIGVWLLHGIVMSSGAP